MRYPIPTRSEECVSLMESATGRDINRDHLMKAFEEYLALVDASIAQQLEAVPASVADGALVAIVTCWGQLVSCFEEAVACLAGKHGVIDQEDVEVAKRLAQSRFIELLIHCNLYDRA